MRILSIQFENLASLKGAHTLNLDDPDIKEHGLLLISGSTGAGKSTIMDAVCLALYGRTPRLKTISAEENHILSTDEKSCSATVIFEEKGERYRSEFLHRKTRKGSKKPFASPEMHLLKNNRVVTDKISEVKKKIPEIIGMEFEQFTQSVMLSQGKFAKFLEARSENRIKILTNITKTEIYRKVSQKSYEKFREQKQLCDSLVEKIGEHTVLSPEEIEDIEKRLEEAAAEKEKLDSRLSALEKEREDWKLYRSGIEKKKSIEEAEKRIAELSGRYETDLLRLETHENRNPLHQLYPTLCTAREEREDKYTTLQKREAALPDAIEKAGQAKEQRELQNQAQQNWQKERNEKMKTLEKVKTLQQSVKDREQKNRELTGTRKEVAEKEETESGNKTDTDEIVKECKKTLKEIENWQKEHSSYRDANLTISRLEPETNQLEELKTQLEKLKKEHTAQLEEVEKSRIEHQKCSENEKDAEDEQKQQQDEKKEKEDRLAGEKDEKELDSSLKALEKTLGILAFRDTLVPDNPCPLCGSTHHPSPVKESAGDITEAIKEFEDRKREVRSLKNEIQDIDSKIKELAVLISRKQTLTTIAENKLNNQKESAEKQEKEIEAIETKCEEIENSLKAYDFEGLQTQTEQWSESEKNRIETEKALSVAENNLPTLEKLIKEYSNSRENLTRDIENNSTLIEQEKAEIESLLDNRTQESIQDEIDQKDSEMKSRDEKVQALYEDTREELTEAKTLKARAEEELAAAETRKQEEEKAFEALLEDFHIRDEELYLKEKLEKTEREDLIEVRDTIKDLKTRAGTLSAEWEKHPVKTEPERAEAEIISDTGKVKEQKESLLERVGAMRNRLESNSGELKKIAELQKEMDEETEKLQVLTELKDLIGSADGKKFSEYAQGIGFGRLLVQANEELQNLSDRYTLNRDEKDPLEIVVYDREKAESRSSKNLSGGEKFLISLALALGLSAFSHCATRIDTLFLDEGFGGLDPRNIDKTIAALKSIGAGKQIVIISHVVQLKEHIPVIVDVIKKGDGSSRIELHTP